MTLKKSTHTSIAQQTWIKKSNRSGSEKSESHIRITSKKRFEKSWLINQTVDHSTSEIANQSIGWWDDQENWSIN